MPRLQPPETFHKEVRIPGAGGAELVLDVEYRWLSRHEFVALCREEGLDDPEFLGRLIKGWDVDEPVSPESLSTLFGYWKMASTRLFEVYRAELLEIEEKN